MTRILKKALRTLLATQNLALVKTNQPMAGLEFVFNTIDRLRIDLVLDVGANTGQTGIELRNHGYRGQIVSFEPQADAFRELQAKCALDANWTCCQLALGASDGTFPIHISEFSPSSSLLPMAKKHLEVWPNSASLRKEPIAVGRLDTLADELAIDEHKTLLKIDTQGYESQVLAGASICLANIKVAYVELLFAPLYEGQSSYVDVMATLKSAGLMFAGLFDTFSDPDTGVALYADGLFIRSQ